MPPQPRRAAASSRRRPARRCSGWRWPPSTATTTPRAHPARGPHWPHSWPPARDRGWWGWNAGAAPLHDLGKIGIPDSILLKPGKLTRRIRGHEDALPARRAHPVGRPPSSRSEREIVRNHHERWDGTGYPAAWGRRHAGRGADRARGGRLRHPHRRAPVQGVVRDRGRRGGDPEAPGRSSTPHRRGLRGPRRRASGSPRRASTAARHAAQVSVAGRAIKGYEALRVSFLCCCRREPRARRLRLPRAAPPGPNAAPAPASTAGATERRRHRRPPRRRDHRLRQRARSASSPRPARSTRASCAAPPTPARASAPRDAVRQRRHCCPTAATSPRSPAATLCLLNGERADRGLTALKVDRELQQAAARPRRRHGRQTATSPTTAATARSPPSASALLATCPTAAPGGSARTSPGAPASSPARRPSWPPG